MKKLIDIITESHYAGMSFSEWLDFYKVPGISIATVENGEINYKCIGVRDRDTNDRIDHETLFQAASISKVLLALLVMRLVEAGKISLDTDIREYTSTTFYKTFDNKEHPVTFRNLLSHTAGFNIHGFIGYLHGTEVPSIDQILKGEAPANNVPLFMSDMPNTKWMYSGGGYTLAQKIVCDVLDTDYESIMREWILQPLRMDHSCFEQPLDTNIHSNFAKGYDEYDMKIIGGFNTMPELAAAGLWTTPGDLAMLGIELMKAISGESDFLSEKSMETILTKPLPGIPTGLGLFFPDENPDGYFEHSGSNLGYVSKMCFHAKQKKGMAVMINSSISCDLISVIEAIVKDAFKDISGFTERDK